MPIKIGRVKYFASEDELLFNQIFHNFACDNQVCVGLVNLSNDEYIIQPDERVAQMVIAKVEQAEIKVAVELSSTQRGEGSFGSTGK